MNELTTETPLTPWHNANNAVWMELDGQPLVAHYGDPQAAQQQVRTGAGLIDRSYRGKLQVAGPDRDALLQSLATNEVEKQVDNSMRANAFCTNNGKVLSLFEGLKQADEWLLDMDPVCTASTAAYLEKYTIIRDAKTVDVTPQYGHLGLYGPQAAAILATVFPGVTPPTEPEAVTSIDEGWITCTNSVALPGLEIIVAADNVAALWQSLLDAGADSGLVPFGFDTLEGLRIEAGIARFGVEASADEILLETGLDDRADFEKGCYVGQETLSRIVFRGRVSRRLCGLLVDGPVPAPGTPVSDGDKTLGSVRSAVHSPALDRTIALAYVKASHWEAGSAVQVGDQTAQVTELPFI